MKESDIDEVNRIIRSLCERRGNCTFVDTHSFLTDSDNWMIQGYFLDDGVDPSPDGYRQWIRALRGTMKD